MCGCVGKKRKGKHAAMFLTHIPTYPHTHIHGALPAAGHESVAYLSAIHTCRGVWQAELRVRVLCGIDSRRSEKPLSDWDCGYPGAVVLQEPLFVTGNDDGFRNSEVPGGGDQWSDFARESHLAFIFRKHHGITMSEYRVAAWRHK